MASSPRAALAVFAVVAGPLAGCAPKIGDHCLVSSDCATNSSRVCDTSQPDGYCTIFNCTDGSCPNNAACVVLQPAVPGCSYTDYQTPSRSSRTLCLATCNSDSDCRTDNGYICASPLGAPWRAIILDNNQSEKVCIVAPVQDDTDGGVVDAAVCMPEPLMSLADATPVDSSTDGEGLIDAQPAESSTDAAESDAPVDAPAEAESPVLDGGLDAADGAGLDAGADEAGVDAAADALADASPADGPSGD